MSFFDTLHFIRPWWFAALVPLAVLLWLLARRRLSGESWEAVCDAHLLSFMLRGRATDARRRGFLYLAGFTGVLAITALAGPAWERLPQPLMRDDSALVVTLDLSLSMNAVDVKPNRLARARFKISDLLTRRGNGRGQTGLVVYARDAFTVVPITDDTAAIELYLQSLDPELMPRQGSRADLGLQEAGALLRKVDAGAGDVLLVADYADARTLRQARSLHDKGYRVSVLGIGTESGGPVSLPSGEFLNHEGEVVIPRFTEAGLNDIARSGGGVYVRFNPFANDDIETLIAQFDSHEVVARDEEEREVTADVWREQGPWLILLMLPIAALGFRRGLLTLAALAVLAQPEPAVAANWADLWLRPDQQGAHALEEGDAARAAELFEDDEWKAAAQYRGKDFAGAVETLEALDDSATWYNKGNALVGAGKLKEAVAAYRHALEIEPEMGDAVHNMGMVEQVLQAMQAQQAQKGEQSGKEEEGEESEGGESGEREQVQMDEQDEESEGEQPQMQAEESGEQGDDEAKQDPDDEGKPDQDDEESGDETADRDDNTSDEGSDENSDLAGSNSSSETMDEQDQAVEQWLRSVPDEPGRLLKRKLRHLSRNKKDDGEQGDKPW